MKRLKAGLLLILLLLMTSQQPLQAQQGSFDLQATIDAAQPGAVIEVPPGFYHGNFVINRPLTLRGSGWPILDADNQGHVLEINGAVDVTIHGLVLRNSGARLDKEDAGITADKAPRLVIENNRLENTLFGIYIKESPHSRISANLIGAKALDVPARGDGIRVWYSEDSEISGNEVDQGRDVVLWYNNGAVIRDNIITNGRYGLHFMYCDDNIVENNYIAGNSVGAFLMYSRRLTLRHNIFANNRGPSGYGIGMKDLDGVEADNNLFSGNRVGMYFDNSPWSVDVYQHFTRNAFVHNDIGLLFTPSVKRNRFSHNSFVDNLEQVGLTGSGTFAENDFTVEGEGNFWSDYIGYDQDGDGLGDLPYVSKSLFENMMDAHPALRLFQLSPAEQAVDLAAQAFPIFQPKPKFSDAAPLMTPVMPAVNPPPAGSNRPIGLAALGLMLVGAGVVALGKIERATLTAKGESTMPAPSVALSEKESIRVESPPIIQVKGLTKRFGRSTAVDDLAFEIKPGEAVALWGPNGAGKTTIIRSLLGLLKAEGELRINGIDAQKNGKRARTAVGYVPQELAFYDDLSTGETARFYARLRHIGSTRAGQVLAEVGLSDHIDKAVGALSGGMKQRLALALALLADPPLLLLDEPTSNLDTKARDDFTKLLLVLKARGKTLLFTSHRLEEVALLADRVLVLDQGRLALVCHQPLELADQLGMQSQLKLIIPERMRPKAIRILETQGFTASQNGVGIKVAVSPAAKIGPLQALFTEEIVVDNFEIDNEFQEGH